MLLWKFSRKFSPRFPVVSFNPCSLGCCSERRLKRLPICSQTCFNPCSLGCCSERSRTQFGAIFTPSFNPCSLGCCSESVCHVGPDPWPWSFNPCSLGCCSESNIRTCIHDFLVRFQSLFSWMLLWKLPPIVRCSSYCASFNPCSLGCCSESQGAEFQFVGFDECFNPCSLGCCSERPAFGVTLPKLAVVSILVLLDVALKDFRWDPRYQIPCRVSILVLLDVALKASGGPLTFHRWPGFNPCSLGCCSESWAAQGVLSGLAIVSILVLLDVALKVTGNHLFFR